jgi:hypothetical protein
MLALSALLSAAPARGAHIRDGAEFTVRVPAEAKPCFVYPAALFEVSTCPADLKPLATLPVVKNSSTLAVVSATLDDGTRVLITAARFERGELDMPTDFAAFSGGMAKQLATSRTGAKVRGTPQASLVKVDRLDLVRASCDIDGFFPDGAAHHVGYASWAEGGTYVVSLTGLTSSASAIDALGYRLVAEMKIAHALPYESASVLSYQLGVLVGAAAVPVLAIVVLGIFFLRDRRKRPD